MAKSKSYLPTWYALRKQHRQQAKQAASGSVAATAAATATAAPAPAPAPAPVTPPPVSRSVPTTQRKGRRPNPAPAPTPTPAPAPAPAPAPTPAPVPASTGGVDAWGFRDTDTQNYHQLYNGRKYFQQQQFDIDTRTALADYLDPNTVGGSMYNASQNMNHALLKGSMNAQQQYMYDSIMAGMHNVGYNVNLTRYDHGNALDAMLKQATGGKVTSASGLSINQLKNMLVGSKYSDKRILSTSYNDFKNAKDPSTFNTRMVKITYQTSAGSQGLMPGIGATPLYGSGMKRGDDFGEFLLAPTGNGHNNYEIVDIKYSGKMARQKGGSTSYLTHKQIEVVVKVD